LGPEATGVWNEAKEEAKQGEELEEELEEEKRLLSISRRV